MTDMQPAPINSTTETLSNETDMDFHPSQAEKRWRKLPCVIYSNSVDATGSEVGDKL
jgi:hypothetical protein